MKYSARLVTALAAVVLLVGAIVGLSTRAQATHAITTHTTGTIFLTNTWSTRTTESPAPTNRTYVGSGNLLYSTFVEQNSSGTAQAEIESAADVLTITVVDADKNIPVTATSTLTFSSTTTAGSSVAFQLDAAAPFRPVIDGNADGLINASDVTVQSGGASAKVFVSNVNPGSETLSGNVTLSTTATVNAGESVTVEWKTSAIDTLAGLVKVTSTQDTTGITLTATETGRNTGRFEVTVQLVDVENTANASTSTAPAKIKIQNGGIVTAEYSDFTPANTTALQTSATKVTATATAETGQPTATVTGPSHNSATQNRRPTFSGSVGDSSSGVKISRVFLFIDDEADAANGAAVEVTVGGGDANSPTLGTGAADGQTSITFTFAPSSDLPAGGLTSVDHKVDWQVRVSDLAGNIGYSDSDGDPSDNVPSACPNPPGTGTACAVGEGSPVGRGAPHVVRIDNTIPNIVDAFTGHFWDTSLTTAALGQNKATSIEVLFDGPIDPASVAISDFEVTISGATQVPTAVDMFTAADAANSVFLTVSTMAANATPTIKVVGQVADTAGNTAAAGALSKVAKDSLGPTLTVTLSGGSSATKPSTLTKDSIKATITSDEPLAGDPIVDIYVADGADAGTDPDFEKTVSAINQGGNTWIATFTKGSSADGKKSVYVTGTDAASVASRTSPATGAATPSCCAPSSNTAGKKDPAATGAITFTLDSTAPTVGLITAGTLTQTTDEKQPFIVIAFSEAVVTINKATLDTVDISASLAASTDKKNYIYKPTTDLTVGAHTIVASGTDEAGNKLGDTTLTLTITERKAFELPLKPGWNLVSLRSEPADTSINSVITVKDISTVITYDPTATGGPWLVATRGTDGKLAGSLTTIDGLHGYWINTTSFEPIKVLDPKPTGGSLPPAIPVSAGWNLVPARDITGTKVAADVIATSTAYFNLTKIQRAYKFDTLTGAYIQLVLTGTTPTDIKVGEAYWAYFTEAGAVVP